MWLLWDPVILLPGVHLGQIKAHIPANSGTHSCSTGLGKDASSLELEKHHRQAADLRRARSPQRQGQFWQQHPWCRLNAPPVLLQRDARAQLMTSKFRA